MAFNKKRQASMRKKSVGQLQDFVKSGYLSAAAAQVELFRRERGKDFVD